MKLLLVYADPSEIFYPSVILRTLYIGTGLRDVNTILLIRRRFKLSDLARFSRVPAEHIDKMLILPADDVVIQEIENFSPEKIVLVTDLTDIDIPQLENISELKQANKICIVIDDRGKFTRLLLENNNLRQRCLRYWLGIFAKPCYETISLLYELIIRDIPSKLYEPPEQDLSEFNISELFYILSHIRDSIVNINNFLFLSPRTLVFSLRHVFLNYGYFVDLVDTQVKFDHVTGTVEEVIKIYIYDSQRLLRVWEEEIVLKDRTLELPFITKNGTLKKLKLVIDPDKRRIIVSKDLVYTGREMSIEDVGQLFQLL